MTFQLESDEFTTWTLLEYLKLAFGAQVNGRAFTIRTIDPWLRASKIPESYGGHRIYQQCRHKALNNVLTFRVEHLNRHDIEEMIGKLDGYTETLNKRRVAPKKKGGRKKVRTELYYQSLPLRRRRGTVIPNNYAELGITKQQIHNVSKSRKS